MSFPANPLGFWVNLVHLYCTVYLVNEEQTRQKADSTSQQRKQKYHDSRVAKVEESACGTSDGQLSSKVMDAIDEEIDPREATS